MQENVRCLPSSKSCVPPSSSSSSTSWSDTDSEVAEPLKEEERQSHVFDCSRNPLEPTLEKRNKHWAVHLELCFFVRHPAFGEDSLLLDPGRWDQEHKTYFSCGHQSKRCLFEDLLGVLMDLFFFFS